MNEQKSPEVNLKEYFLTILEANHQLQLSELASIREHAADQLEAHQREDWTRHNASQEAIAKAEQATEHRFDSVNEFREQLNDITSANITRNEYEAKHETLVQRMESNHSEVTERLNRLSDSVIAITGRSSGLNAGWGYLVGAVALIATILTIAVIIGAHI